MKKRKQKEKAKPTTTKIMCLKIILRLFFLKTLQFIFQPVEILSYF